MEKIHTHRKRCQLNTERLGIDPANLFTHYFIKIIDKVISHPTQLSNTGVCRLSKSLGFDCSLTEEEKHLVVVWVFTLWDPEGSNKLWLW